MTLEEEGSVLLSHGIQDESGLPAIAAECVHLLKKQGPSSWGAIPDKTGGCVYGRPKSAKDMKHRLGVLLQKSDSCDYGSSQGKKEKVSPSQSEENIEFWVSCEDYKKTKSPAKLSPKARKIYDEFISVQATKEVNLDSYTREKTSHNILEPTLSCFDEAQRKIFTLMEKDSYRRFLKSPYYLDLVSPPRAGCGPENCKRTHAHGLDYNSNIISQCA
ncbi:hypothetical protein ASZ78_000179 [Callipepla squamata]|uniref:RGS domain-containing protein n=1 Tax=Callipepla squamata TaxID=9009 RepID=A0A226MRB2_CALSU|nr:hypothetical protein ASZ78_000179 [Callipepla squamata]